jgi:Zn-dependent peptidase ImmA (M78 family)
MTQGYKKPSSIGASKVQIESFAEETAKKLHFAPGDSIEELVERIGGKLVIGSSGDGDVDSGSIVVNALNDFTIYISRLTSLKRDRFTIAHELGHLLLHFMPIKNEDPDAIMRATRWVDEGDSSQQRAEWEANWFAASFLMPASAFKEAFRAGGISGAQRHFNVSFKAAEIRAKSLNIR